MPRGSGKGLPAAVYTAMARYLLRAYAIEESDPARVVHRLNRALCRQIREEARFVTLVYGVLDLQTAAFTHVVAGHPPPILYRDASRACEFLPVTGGIVGAFEEIEYRQQATVLAPGSLLALFTDGITEAADSRQMEEDLLLAVVRSGRGRRGGGPGDPGTGSSRGGRGARR